MATEIDNAENQAKAQLESIKEMLARLEHARECDSDPDDCNITPREWTTLDYEFSDYHDEDAAQQAIYEDPLSVEVRSGWHTQGETSEDEDYCILLCTGGPAVRIIGELGNYGEPASARLQYQDWDTPWTELITTGNDHKALTDYASHFLGG